MVLITPRIYLVVVVLLLVDNVVVVVVDNVMMSKPPSYRSGSEVEISCSSSSSVGVWFLVGSRVVVLATATVVEPRPAELEVLVVAVVGFSLPLDAAGRADVVGSVHRVRWVTVPVLECVGRRCCCCCWRRRSTRPVDTNRGPNRIHGILRSLSLSVVDQGGGRFVKLESAGVTVVARECHRSLHWLTRTGRRRRAVPCRAVVVVLRVDRTREGARSADYPTSCSFPGVPIEKARLSHTSNKQAGTWFDQFIRHIAYLSKSSWTSVVSVGLLLNPGNDGTLAPLIT